MIDQITLTSGHLQTTRAGRRRIHCRSSLNNLEAGLDVWLLNTMSGAIRGC